jgi:hypothetical protein
MTSLADFPNPIPSRAGPLVTLDPESIEAIAARVAELLSAGAPKLLTATEVAERLGRSRGWVYRHRRELGGGALGGGERPRVGFDAAKVANYVASCSEGRGTPGAAQDGDPAADVENGVRPTPRRRTRSARLAIPLPQRRLKVRGERP